MGGEGARLGESEFGVGVGDVEMVLKGQHFSLRRALSSQSGSGPGEGRWNCSPARDGLRDHRA